MASDSMLKFRLGVFVLGSLLLLAMLIVLFGEMPDVFRSQVHYTLKVPQAPAWWKARRCASRASASAKSPVST